MPKNRYASVSIKECVGCGCCEKTCPKSAIHVKGGVCAVVNKEKCVGCGLCQKACPASLISIIEGDLS